MTDRRDKSSVPDRAPDSGRPVQPRDDAETLKEIARRIRQGQMLLRGAAVSDPASGVGADDGSRDGKPGRGGLGGSRLARLAHELKTPLSAIAAAAEIMRDERLGAIGNERYRSYAADIYDSARHALQVIGNMLGDSGAAGGISTVPAMVFAEIDLHSVIESCASSMRPLADAADLVLETALAPRLPHVIADATAVRQIVLNLLTNAVKFTGPGGRLDLATRHAVSGEVEIEISDNGRGMTSGELIRASREDADAPLERRQGGGLGIGLPLVRALARANGATVAISSDPGQGTRVVVAFAKDRVVPV